MKPDAAEPRGASPPSYPARRSFPLLLAALTALGSLGTASARAEAAREPRPAPSIPRLLPGHACLQLTLPDVPDPPPREPVPAGGPGPVRAAPSPDADVIGRAFFSIIVAPVPGRPRDGFLPVLLADGSTGWMEAARLRRWVNITAAVIHCAPQTFRDGTVGYCFHVGPVREALDPDEPVSPQPGGHVRGRPRCGSSVVRAER